MEAEDFMTNYNHRCVTCGGAIDRHGVTLTPLKRRPAPATKRPPQARPVPDDDPMSLLNPVERFNKAIERRDQLKRSRLAD